MRSDGDEEDDRSAEIAAFVEFGCNLFVCLGSKKRRVVLLTIQPHILNRVFFVCWADNSNMPLFLSSFYIFVGCWWVMAAWRMHVPVVDAPTCWRTKTESHIRLSFSLYLSLCVSVSPCLQFFLFIWEQTELSDMFLSVLFILLLTVLTVLSLPPSSFMANILNRKMRRMYRTIFRVQIHVKIFELKDETT